MSHNWDNFTPTFRLQKRNESTKTRLYVTPSNYLTRKLLSRTNINYSRVRGQLNLCALSRETADSQLQRSTHTLSM